MACLPATMLEVTLAQNDCTSAAAQDEHSLGHWWRSPYPQEVSGDSDLSSQSVGADDGLRSHAPLLHLALRLICSSAALLMLRLEKHAGGKSWLSKFCIWGHTWRLTTNYRMQSRELGKDKVALSQRASSNMGLFFFFKYLFIGLHAC